MHYIVRFSLHLSFHLSFREHGPLNLNCKFKIISELQYLGKLALYSLILVTYEYKLVPG